MRFNSPSWPHFIFPFVVPKIGLEPTWLAPPPPQDGVSTNSTTSASIGGLRALCFPSRKQIYCANPPYLNFYSPLLFVDDGAVPLVGIGTPAAGNTGAGAVFCTGCCLLTLGFAAAVKASKGSCCLFSCAIK